MCSCNASFFKTCFVLCVCFVSLVRVSQPGRILCGEELKRTELMAGAHLHTAGPVKEKGGIIDITQVNLPVFLQYCNAARAKGICHRYP